MSWKSYLPRLRASANGDWFVLTADTIPGRLLKGHLLIELGMEELAHSERYCGGRFVGVKERSRRRSAVNRRKGLA